MSFNILPAQRSDIPQIISVANHAFGGDAIVSRMMPDVPAPEREKWDHGYWEQEFDCIHINGMKVYKAVDDAGNIVGVAKWQFPYTLTAEQVSEKEAIKDAWKTRNPTPEKANKQLMDDFIGQLRTKREKYVDQTQDYFLHILVILPPHQRQGLGSKLIAEGLRQADEANARTYIEASKKGLGLYLKFGWEPFDEIALDMTKYGYEGLEVEKILWRPKKEELGEKYRSLSSLANGG